MWFNLVWLTIIILNRFLFTAIPLEILEPLVAVTLPVANMVLRKITTKGVHLWESSTQSSPSLEQGQEK